MSKQKQYLSFKKVKKTHFFVRLIKKTICGGIFLIAFEEKNVVDSRKSRLNSTNLHVAISCYLNHTNSLGRIKMFVIHSLFISTIHNKDTEHIF